MPQNIEKSLDAAGMDFEALLKLLLDRGVKFIVIGGVACALNGFVRATEDVDILVETSVQTIGNKTISHWIPGHVPLRVTARNDGSREL